MNKLNRREFIQRTTATGVALSLPSTMFGQQSTAVNPSGKLIPNCPIPSSGELLGVIGTGTGRVYSEDPAGGGDVPKTLLKTFIEAGGNFIDIKNTAEKNIVCWLKEIGLYDKMFMGSSVGNRHFITGPNQATEEMQESLNIQGRKSLDLVQARNMVDLENRWPIMRAWKDAGKVRHLGVTITMSEEQTKLAAFMKKERPDFISINYSPLETAAEERLLPMATDLGIATLINRPFQNGRFFTRVSNDTLPEWAAEFDCKSWAQFSLKYILANPNVTCIMTETSNPDHLRDNLKAPFGRLPDKSQLKRIRDFMTWV